MTLEEAIKRYTSNAFYEKSDGNLQGYLEFNQLAEWLKDYKRLLEQEPITDRIEYGTDGNAYRLTVSNGKEFKQEPKTGRWIEKDGYDGDTYYDCSECGESWTTIEGTPWNNGMKYCPNCGAKMESEENNAKQ